ncbi:hypothetical protein BDQ17DRAFT_1430474 [Cyathus striatus]|nr:hypothetical protein BDQ17DRAFT_1430474 [Cyathus striatus]
MPEFAASNKFPEDSADFQAMNSTTSADTGIISTKDDIPYSPQATNSTSQEGTGVIVRVNAKDELSYSTKA